MDDCQSPDATNVALPDWGSPDGLLSTGDMARLAESTLRTVRFYESEGLLKTTARGNGGQRLFEKTELARLELALDLRESGLSLQEIKSLFALKRGSSTPGQASEQMIETLERRIDEVQRKITRLRKLREELVAMTSVLAECRACVDGEFPAGCHSCDVVTEAVQPRALRVLWNE